MLNDALLADVHPDLRRHVSTMVFGGVAIGIGGLVLPVLFMVGVPGVSAIPPWALFAVCVTDTGLTYLATSVAPRWYRNASRAVASAEPLEAQVTLRIESSSDSRSLHAHLESSPLPITGSTPHDLALLIPTWEVTPLLAGTQTVSLYLHGPRIVAMRTPAGLLWALPHAHRDA
jgi:hypothetical protein